MKFECETTSLLQALNNATRALNAKPAMQILENVLVRAQEDVVEVTCSDGSLTIRSSAAARVKELGEVLLPGRLFYDIVRMLPEGVVNVSMNDKMSVTITSQNSRSKLTGFEPSDYPRMLDLVDRPAVHLPQKRIRDMMNRVTFAIAAQDSRQELTGCLMELTKDELRFVSLDGFRLALQRMRDDFILPDDTEMIKAIIPGRVMGEMGHIASDDEEMMTFHFDKTHMMATLGATTLVTSLLAGEFINYRQLLPTAWKSRVIAKRKELEDAVDRASLIAREGKNKLIVLRATQDQLQVTSMSEIGDALENLAIHLEGEDIEIAFNARYISDVIRNIDDDCCMLCMNGALSPCYIVPVDGDDYLYLVLPVRVS